MFHGISAFSITPTDAAGRVLKAPLARLVARVDAAGPDAIGLLGSTGEYAYLDRDARRHAVEVAAASRPRGTPLLVGVGALRTDAACALARDAAAAGADALLLAPVSYTPLTEDEVFAHFRAVAGETGLPLCIYDNPSTTGFAFSDELVARLALLPQIAAVKLPLPASGTVADALARLRPRLPEGFPVGYSADWGMAGALLDGADAFYSVVAGLLPDPAIRLARAAQAGDAERARELDAAFAPLWALFRAHGSFRVMFALARMLSLAPADPPRPVLPLEGAALTRLRDALDRLDG